MTAPAQRAGAADVLAGVTRSATPEEQRPAWRAFARAFTRPDAAFGEWLEALRDFQQRAGMPATGRRRRSAAGDSTIDAIIAFLEAVPSSRLAAVRASELAAIGMAEIEASRRLARELGISFRDLHRVFVVRAVAMALTSSAEHVRQIAYRVGYEHASQCDRDFRRVLGVTPRAFRRLVRGS